MDDYNTTLFNHMWRKRNGNEIILCILIDFGNKQNMKIILAELVM